MKHTTTPFYSIVTKPYRILDKTTDKYSEIIRFTKEDASVKEILLPASLAVDSRSLASALRDAGAILPLDAKNYLSDVCSFTSKEVRVLEGQFGWTDGFDNFIFHGGNARNDERIIGVNFQGPEAGKITANGTLKKWKRTILPFAKTSSLMMCTMCTAFAAPLLQIIDAEPFSICLHGRTRGGKSMAKLAAGSIIGYRKKKHMPSWHLTVAHLETVLPRFNDSVFLIDDIQLIPLPERYRKMAGLAYSLAEGREKGRHFSFSGRHATHPHSWSSIVLTSSEHSIAELAREAGTIRDGGELLRMIDVPAYAEGQLHIFDRAGNDFTAGELQVLFKDFLKSLGEAHGTAFPRYIRYLIRTKCLPQFIDKRMKSFVRKAVGSHDDAIVHDIARKFALLYAGGCLAHEFRLIPWKRSEICDAILTCFNRAKSILQTDASLLREGLDILESSLKRLPRFCASNASTFTKAYCRTIVGYSEDKHGHAVAYLKRDEFVRLFVSRRQSQLVEQTLLENGRISKAASKLGHSSTAKVQNRWPDKKRRRSVTIRFDRNTPESK